MLKKEEKSPWTGEKLKPGPEKNVNKKCFTFLLRYFVVVS